MGRERNKYDETIEKHIQHEYNLKHRVYEEDEGESLSNLIDMSKYNITRIKLALQAAIDDLDKILECYKDLF